MKQHLGHYDIVAELGRGGMGVVYKGYETSLNRYVAIKVLADSLAHDESVKERFLREARSMAALNDPHIIQIYFIGDDEGQTYFVMEFVDGESLGSLLKRESKLKPEQAAKIIYETALGLSTAHDKGVIHRDIKPGNLMISSRGSVKIADFGIALTTQDFSKKLTSTGEFVGTPGYLSPEVCQGKPVDQRSDIFSLGIVLFECLAGRMPFTDESPLGLMLEVVRAEIPDVCSLNADVDPELSRILSKMVAKDPAERYQSCQELCTDLHRHPLVAKGGPITLQTKLSPAAATMVGQRTPVSGQRPLPSTTPTPQSLRTPAAVVGAPTGQPRGVHEPVLKAQAPSARSSALPWAIAAIVLLGVAGGAFAFRDRIPMLQQYFGTTTSATSLAATPNTSAPNALAAVPTQAPSAPSNATPASGTPANTNEAVATTATVATPSPPSTQNETTPTPDSAVAVADQSEQRVDAGAPAARASEVEPLKQLAAAQAADAAPAQQVARINEPPPASAPPRPHIPTIAVLSGGDSAVSAPAEQAIEAMLARSGFNVVDEASLPRVSRLMGKDRPRFAEALEVLAKHGRVDAVVFVHARAVGSQELTYYGQSSTLYTAQLGVRAYAIHARRLLGPGWTQQVNFTSLNAAEKANEAVEPMLREVESTLVDYRPKRHRG
ncbi:MAG TPA: protein kinase [Rudaea sp.]|nr:protein kinase [Rudaea sp.]